MHWEKKLSVHSSTAYNSQDMEATQVPIDRWMDGERVVDIYIQGHLAEPQKGCSATHSNMGGPRDHCTKQIRQRMTNTTSHTCGIKKIVKMNLFTK